jgi:hypothetical protein
MPENDATPQPAPAPAGQPAPQAVPPVQQSIPLDTQAAPAAEPAATAPDVTQELETYKKRYADSSTEALRLYRENEALKAAKTAQPTPPTTYSAEQLETWKEQWLVEASTKPEKALEAAHQVRLIDAELRKVELNQFAGKQTAAQAFEQLKTAAVPILNQFQHEFQPGSTMLQETNTLYAQALAAGLPDGDMTKAVAAILALAKHGKFEAGAGMKASQAATQTLNQAIKSAAAAGSGAANQNAAPGPDFSKMNPKTPEGRKAFEEYRRGLGVGK